MTVAVANEQGTTMLKSVELAIRRETQQDWDFADAVYEDVVGRGAHLLLPSEHGVNTGLREAEEAVYKEHQKAGTEVTHSAIHDMFVTRRVWPPEERRPDLASFAVHYALRGGQYRNRKAIIEKQAAKSRNGRWAFRDMRRWKSEQKPPALKTFRELFEERVRRSAYNAGKPWGHVAEEDRQALAAVCRRIANEIEDGTFGQ